MAKSPRTNYGMNTNEYGGRQPMQLVGAAWLYGCMNGELLARHDFEWECVSMR